ncbi:MAG: HAD family phosphatase [Clostridia bacterium]|nr:HAD family phosphatase [Clostridia bacterium]
MVRALFFDLDGTLLNSQKQIPASARQAILRCRAFGVSTFIVTARSPRLHVTLGWTEADFALFDGAIHSNGACIKLGQELRYCFIDPEAVRRCLREVTATENVEMSLHLPEDGHAFTIPAGDDRLAHWRVPPEKLHPISEEALYQTMKILIFHGDLVDDRPPLPAELGQRLTNACAGLARVLVTDQGRTIQVIPMEAGKLQAVERIRQQLGLALEEVAVFGDDLNDLEMIRHYPGSVAMGNGAAEVKAAAGYVTQTNDENGIAAALSQLFPGCFSNTASQQTH